MLLARHSHLPVRGDIYWHPTLELVYTGLNAPADRLSMILYGFLGVRINLLWGNLLYIALAATLGYIVRRTLNSYRFRNAGPQPELSTAM